MSDTDTFVDGGGVLDDQPLPEGSIVRFVIDPGDRQRDITVVLRDGDLKVLGPYRPLISRQLHPNVISVTTGSVSTP